MEAVIGNLTKEEFFGFGPKYSKNLNPSLRQDSNYIGNSILWIIIGGVIVYIFREDIDTFFRKLSGISQDESE